MRLPFGEQSPKCLSLRFETKDEKTFSHNMKKYRILLTISLLGTLFLSSCLKQDPEVDDTTIFYGHQQIPNINTFMPLRLLNAFGDENLHFGDNPPRMEGLYVSHQREVDTFSVVDNSQWLPPMPSPASDIFFDLTEQHIGIAQLHFTYTTDAEHHGSTQQTLEVMRNGLAEFVNDTIAPDYFKGNAYNVNDFGTIYIMGNAPYFTAYYYEIRDTDEKPLFAVILSGKMATGQTIQQDTVSHTTDTITQSFIVDAKFGFEAMRYYGTVADWNKHPYPGDLVVYDCDTLQIVTNNEP